MAATKGESYRRPRRIAKPSPVVGAAHMAANKSKTVAPLKRCATPRRRGLRRRSVRTPSFWRRHAPHHILLNSVNCPVFFGP